MKLKNIFLIGAAAVTLVSCNDFLDVEAPSSNDEHFVFTQKSQIQLALNGVYAQALSGDIYGNQYQRTFILNSDVDVQISSNAAHEHDSYARLDCDAQNMGTNNYKFWKAAYNLLEYANKFIRACEQSSIYNTEDKELMQMIGEAKCLRAMICHDLVVMYGDIPFSLEPSSTRDDLNLPIVDRTKVQQTLIDDLKAIAPYMSAASSTTVERCSKEFAQALIARIALTAGGYSLRPSDTQRYGEMKRPDNYKDFYATAMEYADAVIASGTHHLNKDYQDVFVDECNYKVTNNDDPIFELPFAKESTGNTGYIQGPKYPQYDGVNTVGVWGETSGNGRLNAFYRFLFRDGDMRREFVNGLWQFTYRTMTDGTYVDSVNILADYSVHNNKWSKLWTEAGAAAGSDKQGSTGINYPYMRYADVLLMYAEAANEVNGQPTEKAINCLRQVHSRAFIDGDPAFITAASASKDAFQKAVMDERKWEFAGENSRWRDLVRTNTYSTELVYSFLRYYSVALQSTGASIAAYEDSIKEHDGFDYIDHMPTTIYYHRYNDLANTISELGKRAFAAQLYGNVVNNGNIVKYYPNQTLQGLRIYNAYKVASAPQKSFITLFYKNQDEAANVNWQRTDFYNWSTNEGQVRDQCRFSFYGYIRADDNGNINVNNNGSLNSLDAFADYQPSTLPVVRYLLPYPNEAIARSNGEYSNKYGY